MMRILYKVETEGPSGRERFRLAVAVRLPSQARFELFGPIGGARLIIVLDGDRALLLLPADRQFDVATATPEVMARLTGIPAPPAAILDLLRGRSPCGTAGAGASGAPTAGCDLGGMRCEDRTEGGRLVGETLAREEGGAPAAVVAWTAGEAAGEAWPRVVTVQLPAERVLLTLRMQEGPAEGPLPDLLFQPEAPAGFTRARLLEGPSSLPALAGGPPAAGR